MYGRRPRCKRNLTISEAFGCGHVWTAPAVQEESDYQRSVRVRSCMDGARSARDTSELPTREGAVWRLLLQIGKSHSTTTEAFSTRHASSPPDAPKTPCARDSWPI